MLLGDHLVTMEVRVNPWGAMMLMDVLARAGGGWVETAPDVTHPPSIYQKWGGGLLAVWQGGGGASTHYYHMHTSSLRGYGGTYVIIALSRLSWEESLQGHPVVPLPPPGLLRNRVGG